MASGFYWPFSTEAASQDNRVDQGWDLQSTAGAPVYAIAAGTIGRANADPGGFGNDYPYETLASQPPGAPSNTVYYGHIHVDPSVVGQHVQAGQLIGYTNTTEGQNGSGAPPGWLEIGFADPGTGAPVTPGPGATTGGQIMQSMLQGAPVATTGTTTGGGSDSINAIVTSVAQQIAARYGVDPNRLTQIALATMQVESGGNPTAVGDNGTSYGLFQLHQGGELGNLTEQQAFDPTTNAQTAIAVMASVLKSNPGYDNGQIAALAQRPQDPASYASSVDQVLAGGTQNIGMGQTAGASGTSATGTNAVNVPGLNDIPGLDAYIRTNLGADAWLLDIPGSAGAQLKNIIETAVATGHGADAAYITTQIQGSDWYKTTSANVRNFTQQSQTDPANYNFGTPGSIAAQQLQDVKAIAASAGVTITDANARSLAMDVLMYGWDANQLKAAIGSSVYINGTGATQTTDAGPVLTQLQSSAGQYLINPQDPVLQTFAQGIVSGTQTIDQYDAWLKQQASLKWTGMAPQIAQGYTPNQIVNNLRQNAAQTMEVDPSSINFVTDPTYQKILDYVPPSSPNGVHRIMTQSEMDQYLKATPQWATTQQSRDQIGNLAQTITSALGKVAG